jgi:hypothetical protein
MQYITHNGINQKRPMQQVQTAKSTTQKNRWLQRLYTTGFVFFLAKGVVWIVAVSWAVY